MTMTYSTYIGKLTSIVESTILYLDTETLTESAEDAAAPATVTKKKNILIRAFQAILKAIARVMEKIKLKYAELKKKRENKAVKFTLLKDVSIPKKASIEKLNTFFGDVWKYTDDLRKQGGADNIVETIKKVGDLPTTNYKAGTTINKHDVLTWDASFAEVLRLGTRIETIANSTIKFLQDAKEHSGPVTGEMKVFGATDIILADNQLKIFLALLEITNNKMAVDLSNAATSFGTFTGGKSMNETVTTKLSRVKAMLETVEELTNKLDSIDETEDKDTEETPEVAKDYPDETSGGAGEEIDNEELSSIVGDDNVKDAVEIATDDSDAKTINEAIDFLFSL